MNNKDAKLVFVAKEMEIVQELPCEVLSVYVLFVQIAVAVPNMILSFNCCISIRYILKSCNRIAQFFLSGRWSVNDQPKFYSCVFFSIMLFVWRVKMKKKGNSNTVS